MTTTIGRLDVQLLAFNGAPGRADATARLVAASDTARDVAWATAAGMAGQLIPATTDSKTPGLEGWWRLRGAPVAIGDPEVILAFVDVIFSLDQVGRAAEVRHEARLIGGALANGQALTSSDEEPIYAPPGGHYNWTGSGTALTRVSADGDIVVYRNVTRGLFPSWQVDPADYYTGAPTLTVAGAPVTGLVSRPGAWSLGNGLVRVSQSSGDLVVESYDPDGADWDSSVTMTLGDSSGDLTITWGDALVLFDTAEQVGIRVAGTDANGVAWQLDLSVRRGDRLIRARAFRATGTSNLYVTSGEASTDDTGGAYSTAADAAGNRAVIVCLQDHIVTGASGTVTTPGVSELVAWFGHEIGGASAVAGDTFSELVAQALAGVDVSERAVRA